MPSTKELQRSVTSFQRIERIENKRVREAFDKAAAAYDAAGNLGAAKAILAERDAFLKNGETDSAIPAVDLLRLIDPTIHAADGLWKKEGDVLISTPGPLTRVRIPYEPPVNYDLQVQLQRLSGASDFLICLKSGNRQFVIVLDGWGASISGISSVDGKLANANPTTFRGQVFQNQRLALVTASIRSSDIKVAVDGKPIISLTGGALSLPKGRQDGFSFGVQEGASYRILKATLEPVRE